MNEKTSKKKKEIKNNLSCDLLFIEIVFYEKQFYQKLGRFEGKVCIGYVLWQKK